MDEKERSAKREAAIGTLATSMLRSLDSGGFANPFVGWVDEAGDVVGDVMISAEGSPTSDQFWSVVREHCQDLARSGVAVIVVGVTVTLFPIGMRGNWGLGGPGDGKRLENEQASLAVTGKEATSGVAVMAADRVDASAKLFVPRKEGNEAPTFGEDVYKRLTEATRTLFLDLPWPALN